MKIRYSCKVEDIDEEADLEEDLGPRGAKFEVIVKFVVEASNLEDAEASVNDVIQEGDLEAY